MYISLLLAVNMQSIGSIWIYLGFKLNQEYIVSQLCLNRFDTIPTCKGSCYLEEKIKEEKNNTDTQVNIKLFEIIMVLPVFNLNPLKKNHQPVDKTIFGRTYSNSLPEGFCNSIFRPPLLLS